MGEGAERIRIIGVPVQAEETRSAAVCISASGQVRVVAAARNFLVAADPASGGVGQYPYPGGAAEYPYASMSGSDGAFYTGSGSQLMAFDPFAGRYTLAEAPAPEEKFVGMAFAEDVWGCVYATTFPSCKLVRLDPRDGRLEVLGRLDDRQKYAMTLAVDRAGWVYAGIGTERPSISAWSPEDGGSVRQLMQEQDGGAGSAHVHTGEDGEVYGRLREGSPWYRLREGSMEPVPDGQISPSLYSGAGYNKLHRQLSGDERIAEVNLSDRELVLERSAAAAGGRRRVVALPYETEGTMLSPLGLGPDGRIYGTSNHPLHLFAYDCATDEMIGYGGRAVQYGGGGNICAYAVLGPHLVGAAYAGGFVHVLDTRRPIGEGGDEPGDAGVPGGGSDPKGGSVHERNPVCAGSYAEIYRPRAAAAHPGGEYAVFGGFPGYGNVGGGLCLFHLPTMSAQTYSHEQVVPYQSTVNLAFLDAERLAGCTSIETPGGAEPVAAEAELYIWEWSSGKVVRRWTPVPGAREISLLAADGRGMLHAITSDAIYFAFDPELGQVLRRLDLSAWGKPVRQGLEVASIGGGEPSVYGLLSGAVYRIGAESGDLEMMAEPEFPVTAGMAIAGEHLYFAAGSKLASIRLA